MPQSVAFPRGTIGGTHDRSDTLDRWTETTPAIDTGKPGYFTQYMALYGGVTMLTEIKKRLFENEIIVDSKNIHVAIVNEPYLEFIKKGKKTIESRFTENKIAPYKNAQKGDIVCMKAAGKPIDSTFFIENLYFFEYTESVFASIRDKYARDICAMDENFWKVREGKQYISLLKIDRVNVLRKNFNIEKKDMRGWITFKNEKYIKVILISGKIGSGKTYFANKIAEKYHLDHVTFSDYIKAICEQRGLEITRPNLQIIGKEVVATKKERSKFIYYLLNCVIKKSSKTIIIDGLRHPGILNEIRELGYETKLIYVSCSEEQRKRNIKNRGEETNNIDKDSTEAFNDELERRSDYIVANNIDTCLDLEEIKNIFPMTNLFDSFD
ncbi:MAG: AAA family ATPase [Treponema sp.]|jgi:dephospho-CoA kinase|nr:AAA family ATPase [Treponema sp.]